MGSITRTPHVLRPSGFGTRFNMQARYRGALIGGAIGDSLGMPTEGLTRRQIIQNFGPRIDKFLSKPNGRLIAGQWTDDTVLTMATVDSLINEHSLNPRGISIEFAKAYRAEESRGFGDTTKTALRRIAKGVPWTKSGFSGPLSSGNGVAMRIAPIALFSYGDMEQLKRNCELIGRITHNDKEALNGGLAIAYVMARILNNSFDRTTIIEDTANFIAPSDLSYFISSISETLKEDLSVEEALMKIGTGASVFETVSASLYLFLRFLGDFEESVVTAASYGGDTDTIGAIVGNLAGAYLGDTAIPDKWVTGVEQGKIILKKADSLYRLSHGI